MTLSALIKKGGLSKAMTATPATVATLEADKSVTVASVATVAVAEGTEPSVENVPVGTVPASELLPDEESNILAWLAHIDETDLAIIAEVLDKCRDDLDARRYFLKRSEEVPPPVINAEQVICGNCTHFEPINHPNLGHCTKGEPEAIAGLWDTSHRFCKSYMPLIDQQGDCYAYN